MRLKGHLKKIVRSGPLFIAFAALMALYTNCSCSSTEHFESTQASFSAEGTGNGTNYDGKPDPGEYYRQLPSYDCAQTKNVYQVLSVGLRDATLHTVSAETCEMRSKKIDLSTIEARTYNHDVIGYLEGAFEKAQAIPDPHAPGAKRLESWCRTSDSAPIDVVVRESISSGTLTAMIYSPDKAPSELGLSRSQSGARIEYTSQDFDLSVDQASGTGALVMRSSGARRVVSCRTGGWQDLQEKFAPAFSLNFSAQALPAEVQFARGSLATYIDANLNVKKAAPGEPRFEFDPQTGTLKGLLIEDASSNLLTFSEQIDQPSFSNRGEVNIVRDSGVAPDGSLSADALIADGNFGWHFIGQPVGVQNLSRPYTCSVFVKAQGISKGLLKIEKAEFDFVRTDFDLATSSAVAQTSGTGAQPIVSVTRLGQGWHRVSVSGVVDPAGGSGSVLCTLFLDQQMMAGDNVKGMLVWGFQLEQGRKATSYIPADASAATRSQDVLRVSDVSWFNSSEGSVSVRTQRGPAQAGETASAFEFAQPDSGFYRLDYASGSGLMATLRPDPNGPSSVWSSSVSLAGEVLLTSIMAYGANAPPMLYVSGSADAGPMDALSPLRPTVLSIGGSASGMSLGGVVKTFTYWSHRLPGSTLDELSRGTP